MAWRQQAPSHSFGLANMVLRQQDLLQALEAGRLETSFRTSCGLTKQKFLRLMRA